MKIIKRKNTKIIHGTCGEIQEMFGADNIGIAYVVITKKFKPHLHQEMAEVYYILKGKGLITIGNEQQEVEKDDIIPIPKNEFHTIEKISSESLELLAITSPEYNPNDVIEKSI